MLDRILGVYQYNNNASREEAVIIAKILLAFLFYMAILFLPKYINIFPEYIGIFKVLLLLIFIFYVFYVYRNLRKHNAKIKQLTKKYNNHDTYPKPFKRAVWVIVMTVISGLILYLLGDECKDCPEWIKKIFTHLNIDTSQQALIKLSSLIITAPIVFIIWTFRDKNKLLEIENKRKDTNLKEFQQLQRWATGNIDGDNKDNKTSLQISALHALRPYLKGEYGDSFRRGAYEIFRSTLASQHTKILTQVKNKEFNNIESAINNCQLTKQINVIASEEWFNLLINHDFPTAGISLVGVNLQDTFLQHKKYGKRLDLNGAELNGANLKSAELSGANLESAELSGAYLSSAELSGTNLEYAKLSGADLTNAKLYGAYSKEKDYLYFEARIKQKIDKDTDLSGVKQEPLTDDEKQKLIKKLEQFDEYYIKGAIERIKNSNTAYDLTGAKTGILTQEMADEIIKNYKNNK